MTIPVAQLTSSQSNEITAHHMLGYTSESWFQAYQNLGPVFKIQMGDEQHTVLCGHAANLEAWRRPDDWNYADTVGGKFFRSEMGADHVTQLDGEAHRRARKLILPAMGVKALMRDFKHVLASMDGSFKSLPNGEFDLYSYTNLIYARALAVSQVKLTVADETIRHLAEFEEWFISGLRISPELQKEFHSTKQYLDIKAKAFGLFEQVVAERKSGMRFNDSLDLILDRPAVEGFEPLDHSELIKAVYLLSVAGVGNISNLFVAATWLLLSHPEWLERLREEVNGADLSDMQNGMGKFPVLKAIVSETERYYQPTPAIQKITTTDVEILGHTIPTGESVLHIHGLAHYDPELYESPFEFNPGRWLEGRAEKPHAFGGGKHLCLGMGVARLFVPLSLSLLLGQYDVKAETAPKNVLLAPDIPSSPETTQFNITATPC